MIDWKKIVDEGRTRYKNLGPLDQGCRITLELMFAAFGVEAGITYEELAQRGAKLLKLEEAAAEAESRAHVGGPSTLQMQAEWEASLFPEERALIEAERTALNARQAKSRAAAGTECWSGASMQSQAEFEKELKRQAVAKIAEWEVSLRTGPPFEKTIEQLQRGINEERKAAAKKFECGCGGPEGHVPNGIWCRK